MLDTYIVPILYVSGALTSSLFLQFLAPRFSLKAFNGLAVADELTLFFARAMALPIGLIGVLLIWAAVDPALRVPVIVVALIGKVAFIANILAHWKIVGRGYVLTIVVDSLMVALFGLYLVGV